MSGESLLAAVTNLISLETVFSVGFGGLVSAIISYAFYRRASRDALKQAQDASKHLDEQIKTLEALIATLARALHGKGVAEFRFDEAGKPVGVIHRIELKESFTMGDFQASMEGRVERGSEA
ncbi:hypothetical protein [Achromobacter denitrificans]|uniref:hypothetical protein n=1 Tax=Achromobacter denitrificans TaxID=32002 RepID=UPI003B9A9ED0